MIKILNEIINRNIFFHHLTKKKTKEHVIELYGLMYKYCNKNNIIIFTIILLTSASMLNTHERDMQFNICDVLKHLGIGTKASI